MLETVILPIEITVHLGRPNVPARDVTVDFIYYLKNVLHQKYILLGLMKL